MPAHFAKLLSLTLRNRWFYFYTDGRKMGQTDEHIDGQIDGRTERLTKRQT